MPIGYIRIKQIAREYDIICRLSCLGDYSTLGHKSILRSEYVFETHMPDCYGYTAWIYSSKTYP